MGKENCVSFYKNGEILKCADQTANVTRGVQNSPVFDNYFALFSFLKSYQEKKKNPTGRGSLTLILCQVLPWSECDLFHKNQIKHGFWSCTPVACAGPPLLGVTKDNKKTKPATYKLYDFTKGGTDIVAQRAGFYSCKMKTPRWST